MILFNVDLDSTTQLLQACSVFDSAVDAKNASEGVHSNLSMLDSAVAVRRGSEGVSLLLRANHNNAEGRQTRMR